MSLKLKTWIYLAVGLLVSVSVCACASGKGETKFPMEPDKIIIGTAGSEREILPNDGAYREILSQMKERVDRSEAFDRVLSIAHDPESGKHASVEMRKSETFVEFVYNAPTEQKFNTMQAGGKATTEGIEVRCLFFPLTGEYHKCFFIGRDGNYDSAITMGNLADNTALISNVRDLMAT